MPIRMSLSLSAAFAMQLGNEPLEIGQTSEAIMTVMTLMTESFLFNV